MFRTVLVDDEELALNELRFLLRKIGNIKIINSYTNPLTALEQLKNDKPNLVFLDIDMPEVSGFSLAQEILSIKKNINVVFVTAYNDYAVKAFEINAVDYILKPVFFDRLKLCIDRIREKNVQNISNELLYELQDKAGKKSGYNKIVISNDSEINIFNTEDVLYFTSEQGKTIIVTNNGKHNTKDSLDTWEVKLRTKDFYRCHRSYIVNINRIKKIYSWFGNSYNIKLDITNDSIPVSKRRVKDLKNLIGVAS
ncbi:MAG: LytTR family DNA-binding domain-containing protein [Ruminiclostridium sp.]|nr:LytTR family DNA-binding domain-containing protein [Ruminiclostridium sp.]